MAKKVPVFIAVTWLCENKFVLSSNLPALTRKGTTVEASAEDVSAFIEKLNVFGGVAPNTILIEPGGWTVFVWYMDSEFAGMFLSLFGIDAPAGMITKEG